MFLVSAELVVVLKFAYYFCKSAPQTYINVKLETLHNKMIDFCLKKHHIAKFIHAICQNFRLILGVKT